MKKLAVLLPLLVCALGAGNAKPQVKPALKVAVSPTYYPMMFRFDSGQLDGFDIAYVKELSKKLDRPIAHVVVTDHDLVEDVRNGKADLAMSAIDLYGDPKGMTYVEYFQIPEALVAKASSKFQAGADPDLKQAIIGSLTTADAREHFHKLAEKKLVAKSRGYEGEPALMDALERDMVDAVVLHLPSALVKVKESKGKLKLLAPEVGRQGVGIAVDPKQPELHKAVVAAAKELQKDGTVGKLEKAYFADLYKQAHTAVSQ